jgi:hypothetical protein
MTESEWLSYTDPDQLLKPLTEQPDWEKLRALAFACLRRIWHLVPPGGWRRAAEVAERFMAHSASREEVDATIRWTDGALEDLDFGGPSHPQLRVEYHAALAVFRFFRWMNHEGMAIGVAQHARQALGRQAWHRIGQDGVEETYPQALEAYEAAMREEGRCQCDLIRDIFPFRPIAIDSRWRTLAVTALAKTIYDERRFADMPILGDALEEAGCTAADLLAHCRESREHVRGCWAVDLLRDKECDSPVQG